MDKKNNENMGMSLLNKGKRGMIKVIFSRVGLFAVLMAVQVMLTFSLFRWFENYLPHYFAFQAVFMIIMILYLLNSTIDPSAKITWLILIMLAPVFGTVMLFYTKADIGHRAIKERIAYLIKETDSYIKQDEEVFSKVENDSKETAALARYIQRGGCFPVYDKSSVKYFPLGEDKFKQLLIELEQAKDFIFLEYFIVNEGIMWGQVLDILARKVKEGVEVRMMYDGTCEFSTLPHDYPKRLAKLGIQCKMFAPISPFVSTHYNYRDHRKILVIDGHTAFTGGVNLADEYINTYEKYGHWKDTAIMVKGEAVKSFTMMFLQMWNITEREPEFDKYLNYPTRPVEDAGGYVLPYGDCPLDSEKAGEMVYIDILNRAERYVHIMTPYLILDGEMETAIKFAAERGVEVSIILPGIEDKTMPYALAKTHYKSLLDSGVKIYEYVPGFVHAKVFVSDDIKAVVGTINLDYRSLYHHFECAAYMYGSECIDDIEKDFQDTLSKCRSINETNIYEGRRGLKVLGILLKSVAPLL